jgi:hypothetical protein
MYYWIFMLLSHNIPYMSRLFQNPVGFGTSSIVNPARSLELTKAPGRHKVKETVLNPRLRSQKLKFWESPCFQRFYSFIIAAFRFKPFIPKM